MRFFATWNQSWELVQMSWRILLKDRQLIIFPLISLLGAVGVSLAFAVPLAIVGLTSNAYYAQGVGALTSAQRTLGLVVVFAYYLAMSLITTYANMALSGFVMRGFAGQKPTVRDGFQLAASRLSAIIGFALINATVGVLLMLIRQVGGGNEKNPIGALLSSLLASLLQTAWNITTFLAVPVIAVENVGAIEAVKRSAELLRSTWGRQILGNFSIGGVFGFIGIILLLVIGLPLYLLFNATGSILVLVLGIALLAIIVAGLSLVQGAMQSIFRMALYRYAFDRSVVYFDQALLRDSFSPRYV